MKQLVNHINGRNLSICFKADAKLGQIKTWIQDNLHQLDDELGFNEIDSCVVSLDKEGDRDVIHISGDEDSYWLDLDTITPIELPSPTSYKFMSTYGWLIVDEEGVPILEECSWDSPNWLENIGKVDLTELLYYHKVCGFEINQTGLTGDVLDFGYWDNSGNYHAPERDWRVGIFHNVNKTSEEQLSDIQKSEDWIEINRY